MDFKSYFNKEVDSLMKQKCDRLCNEEDYYLAKWCKIGCHRGGEFLSETIFNKVYTEKESACAAYMQESNMMTNIGLL